MTHDAHAAAGTPQPLPVHAYGPRCPRHSLELSGGPVAFRCPAGPLGHRVTAADIDDAVEARHSGSGFARRLQPGRSCPGSDPRPARHLRNHPALPMRTLLGVPAATMRNKRQRGRGLPPGQVRPRPPHRPAQRHRHDRGPQRRRAGVHPRHAPRRRHPRRRPVSARSYADRAHARADNATMCGDCGQRPAYARGRCEACWRAAHRASGGFTEHVPSAWHLPPAWTEEALCAQVDAELFFPERATWWQVPLAKNVCAACPVRARCLDWALAAGETEHGIWGGLTPAERRAEKKRRKAAAVGGDEAA